jgi:SLT domain-containing protein
MQVIQPTFDAYHSAVLSTDIFDPAASIYAGLAYAINRYGAISSVPGVIAVKAGRKYIGY